MATEMFEAVRNAEAKAEAVLAAAQRESLRLVKDAEAECIRIERETAKEHRALYQSIIEKKREDMSRELNSRAEGERKAIGAQMDAARARLGSAVKEITERVWADGNR